MCQLLGMNCAAPTDFSFSFRGFCQRGGATDIHSHGFGLALYEGRGLRSFLDTQPASESPIAKLVQNYPIRTYNMMAHVRYATTGEVSLENVHPFFRELWGIQWCFAHNGQVPKFDDSTPQENQPLLGKTRCDQIHYNPVGDTDSEAVFCAILNALKAEFDELPTLPVLHAFLSKISYEIISGEESSTIFNFLLGCGQYTLFAYSWPGRRPSSKVWNGLFYKIREPPFSTAKLIDVDYSIDFSTVATPNDRVAVITTKPLTNEEGWVEFERGQLLMFDKGLPYKTPRCCEFVEREGRGLYSKCFLRQRRSDFACSQLSTSPSTDGLPLKTPETVLAPSSISLHPQQVSLSVPMLSTPTTDSCDAGLTQQVTCDRKHDDGDEHKTKEKDMVDRLEPQRHRNMESNLSKILAEVASEQPNRVNIAC